MKILITGIAGTGKSTIAKALNEKGVEAVDLHDVPGVFFWQDKKTGAPVEYAPVHSKDWFDTVDRLCDIKKVKGIFEQNPAIVMVGSTSGSNQNEFFLLFDKIILLQSNPDTLIHRMQTRINKSGYGKTEAEQEDNIEWQKEYDPLLISLGAIPVSTEGDLDSVVGKIIEMIKST